MSKLLGSLQNIHLLRCSQTLNGTLCFKDIYWYGHSGNLIGIFYVEFCVTTVGLETGIARCCIGE